MRRRSCLAALTLLFCAPAHSEHLQPQVFEPGTISTRAVEVGLALEPDGNTMYFTRYPGVWGADLGPGTIHVSRRGTGGWGAPEAAAFSGQHDDGDVSISPDGRFLLFTSTRPDRGGARSDPDILMMSRSPEGRWGAPERLPAPVNSRAREMSPVLTANGRLYFVSDREGGLGQGDIYVADFDGDELSEPVNLGPAINTREGEWNLTVDPQERFLIFEASRRPENRSASGDLWISHRRDRHWAAAVPLAAINTEGSDLAPSISPDGHTLYYTSTRERRGTNADILRVDLAALLADHPPAPASAQPSLAVVSRGGHFLALVDAQRGEIQARIPTGRGPHETALAPDGLRAYVANYGIYPVADQAGSPNVRFVSEPGGTVTVADLDRHVVLAEWTLEMCGRPHGIAASRDGLRVWVTCEDTRTVLELEAATGRTLARFITGRPGSHMVAANNAETLLFVSNVDDGSVTVIDRRTGSVRHVPTGTAAEGSAFDPTGRELWVLNAAANTVSVLGTEDAKVLATFDSAGRFPIRVQFDAQRSQAWIANNASRSIAVFDARARRLLASLPIDDIVLGLLIPHGSDFGYATLPRRGQVAVIDLASRRIVRRIDVGPEVDGLAWRAARAGAVTR